MKGVRFYLEHDTPAKKRRGDHSGNCVAIMSGTQPYQTGGNMHIETLAAVYARPNSPVATTGYSVKRLNNFCKRISEAEARKIHPALFRRLDA